MHCNAYVQNLPLVPMQPPQQNRCVIISIILLIMSSSSLDSHATSPIPRGRTVWAQQMHVFSCEGLRADACLAHHTSENITVLSSSKSTFLTINSTPTNQIMTCLYWTHSNNSKAFNIVLDQEDISQRYSCYCKKISCTILANCIMPWKFLFCWHLVMLFVRWAKEIVHP